MSGPRSVTRLPLTPIFTRFNVAERHRAKGSGAQTDLRSSSGLFVKRSLVASPKLMEPHGSNQCWIGECEGCGMTLISAVWHPLDQRKAYCTDACRKQHA